MAEEIENPDNLINRDHLDRGLALDRYSGETVYALIPTGFGEGEFGDGIYGWT